MSAICISGGATLHPPAADTQLLDSVFVVPGDEIFVDHEGGFLKCGAGEGEPRATTKTAARLCRGHGTQLVDGRLLATLCGVVARVNKLVSVRPLKSRHVPRGADPDAAAEAHAARLSQIHRGDG